MRLCFFAVVLVTVSSAVADDAAINVTLQGKWVGSARDGTKVTYDFDKDGSITWYVDEENFTKMAPKGLKGKYKIQVADPVWQVDITDFDHPQFKQIAFLGIIEIVDAKSFRMEGRPNQRPKEFGPAAVVFRAQSK
jgi:hypothetical protein